MSSGVHDLTGLSDAALDDLLAACSDERERRRTLREAPAESEVLARRHELAAAAGEPVSWGELVAAPDRVGPGQRVVWADGEVWRNASRAWLPITATPETYPLGWAQETGLPSVVAPWVAGEMVQAGDLRMYEGVVYRCVTGHTTQADWLPGLLLALWVPQTGGA